MNIAIFSYKDEENRTAQLREFAAKRTWPIFDEFIDPRSGMKIADSPEFKRMLDAAQERKFDYVLRWLDKPDKIEMMSSAELLHRFESSVLEKLIGVSMNRLADLRSESREK